MEQTIVDSVQLSGSSELDLSIIGLFMSADPIVQAVMIGLVIVSVCTWAIILDKVFKLRRLRSNIRSFEDSFWSGGDLESLYDHIGNTPSDPMSLVFCEGMREWRRSKAHGLVSKGEEVKASLMERLQQMSNLTIDREMEQLEKNMSFLASVGSTAPFVGLFGTVWGIMDAFQSIAATKTTALSVVAPGIAEALFATALGLVAAIPAQVYTKEDLYVYMNAKTYRFYISAISALSAFPFNHMGQYTPEFEVVKIAVCQGMPDNQMVAAQKSNLFFGTDLISDHSEIRMLDMSDIDGSDNLRVVAKFTAGCQHGIGADIVHQS